MNRIIRNIAQLVAVPGGPVANIAAGPFAGRAFSEPQVVSDAALVIEGDRIAWIGRAAEAPAGPFDETLDAGGGVVTPGLVDCHTHVVFAGNRAGEYVRKIRGESYLEILQAGGGIRSTMRAVRAASIDDLARESLPRLQRMLEWGATTVEIKTGYGLSPDDELKMLRAIQALRKLSPIELVPTFLGAHAVPPEYEGRPDAYLDSISAPELLGRIRDENLAEFADVFCEKGAFTLEQSNAFLSRCAKSGLTPKVHAEQLTNTGSAQMGVMLAAASVDHLEHIDSDGIEQLRVSHVDGLMSRHRPNVLTTPEHAATIPVLLPGCTFFLGGAPAPARRMIDAGLPVALATDCNPGSSMIESLPLIMSMACSILKMTPMEALVACTANAAAALRRADRLGALERGMQADLLVLGIDDVNQWPYRVGVNPVRMVIKAGRVVLRRA